MFDNLSKKDKYYLLFITIFSCILVGYYINYPDNLFNYFSSLKSVLNEGKYYRSFYLGENDRHTIFYNSVSLQSALTRFQWICQPAFDRQPA